MNKIIKFIFIHGNGNCSPQDMWYPHLKQALEKLGFNVIARQFPDAYLARAAYWLPFLKHELKADEQTILIGHSSGALAAMRFAENNKILGSILISAMHTDLGIETEIKSGYFNKPWNWQNIKNNQKWIIQFASTDDPWIPIEEARFIKEQLNTDYYEYTNQGHFNKNDTFPELISIIKKRLLL